jgi:HEAT repeat protein
MKIVRCAFLFAVLALLFFAICVPLTADDTMEALMRLYTQKGDITQRYDIMRSIVKKNDPNTVPFLTESLDELNQMGVLPDKKDEEVRKNLKMLLVQALGDMKAGKAGPVIFKTVKDAEDPYLEGEAIHSLGKIGDKQYAEEIALILKNLNTYRGGDVAADEAIAYGCIKAIGLLGDPVGYFPVFFSLSAGYSRKIQDAARSALNNLVEDPSDILRSLVVNEPSLSLKVEGLTAAAVSKAPKEKKSAVAATALRVGFTTKPANTEEAGILRELRVKALQLCIELGYANTQAIPLIEQIFNINTDDNEKMFAIEALKSMKCEDSALALTRYLAFQNGRQEAGVKERDNKLVIATVRALGSSGSRAGLQELLRVKFSGYTPTVTREADRAIEMIQNSP